MKKKMLMEVYDIQCKKGRSIEHNPGIRIVHDHDISASSLVKILYAIFVKYLDAIDDRYQLQFIKQVQEMFNELVKSIPEEVEERVIEDITSIEDVDDAEEE